MTMHCFRPLQVSGAFLVLYVFLVLFRVLLRLLFTIHV